MAHHDRIQDRLLAQEGVVARWQLLQDGLSRAAAQHLVVGWRRVHSGVFVSGHAPLTPRQRAWAAVCTAPGTTLSHASAAVLHGVWTRRLPFDTVTRRGGGGPRRHGTLLVCHTRALVPDDVVRAGGLPVTSGARTVLDLLPHHGDRDARRLVREALRVGVATADDLRQATERHRGRRGAERLRALAAEYAPLPLIRTRSDAEALAVELCRAAGRAQPDVNVVIAGQEADLSWPGHRLIVELDGPAYHRVPTEDARRDRVWRAAGWDVRRISTDVVYDEPTRFLTLTPGPRPTPPPAPAPRRASRASASP